jgi:DtxR family Mn-dependent transcriptional regulator
VDTPIESIRDGDRESRVAVQDYVKAIWALENDSPEGDAATGAIAVQLGVSSASVSGMVRRLEQDGLVVREPYRGVRLTDRGRSLALEMVRHHRLLESFLSRALGMSWDRIHAEAEVLEHHISEELEELIDEHLGRPEFDPHGHPIPRRDGTVPDQPVTSLATLKPGTHAVVAQVRDDSPDVLRYLDERSLAVGAQIELVERDGIADTITLSIEGRAPVVLGMGLARRIDLRGDEQ